MPSVPTYEFHTVADLCLRKWSRDVEYGKKKFDTFHRCAFFEGYKHFRSGKKFIPYVITLWDLLDYEYLEATFPPPSTSLSKNRRSNEN